MKANSLSSAKNLKDLVTKLVTGLKKLTLEDNTESFKVQAVEIAPGETVTIRNELTFIPSQYIITSQEGEGIVTKTTLDATSALTGENNKNTTLDWSLNNLYLINHGPDTVKVTVLFMR